MKATPAQGGRAEGADACGLDPAEHAPGGFRRPFDGTTCRAGRLLFVRGRSGPSLIFCACGEEDGGVALDRLKQRLGRRLGLVPGDEERAHARVDRHARHAGNGLEHARDLPARLGLQAVKHGMAQARASRQQASHAVANVCHVCLLMRRPWLRARSRQRAERRRPPNRRRGSRRPGG